MTELFTGSCAAGDLQAAFIAYKDTYSKSAGQQHFCDALGRSLAGASEKTVTAFFAQKDIENYPEIKQSYKAAMARNKERQEQTHSAMNKDPESRLTGLYTSYMKNKTVDFEVRDLLAKLLADDAKAHPGDTSRLAYKIMKSAPLEERHYSLKMQLIRQHGFEAPLSITTGEIFPEGKGLGSGPAPVTDIAR